MEFEIMKLSKNVSPKHKYELTIMCNKKYSDNSIYLNKNLINDIGNCISIYQGTDDDGNKKIAIHNSDIKNDEAIIVNTKGVINNKYIVDLIKKTYNNVRKFYLKNEEGYFVLYPI